MKYFVESYGCTMNYGEGEELAETMRRLGHEPAARAEDADVIILNTCTVVQTTERRMLRRMSDIGRSGKEAVVTGCMARAQASKVRMVLPDSVVIAPGEYGTFRERMEERYGRSDASAVRSIGISAVLPIAQGCLGDCSYCITRTARGRLRSYPPEELADRFRRMVEGGAREILVTAQDTGCYGADIGTDLPALLDRMLGTEGEYMVRIGMMNPDSLVPIADRLMDVMRDRRVYRFLHIPVQSGSDDVLGRMNRRYTVAGFRELVGRIRSVYPDMGISTDIITGFPGETEDDHAKSMELLEWLNADTVNVTRFSPRPGTEAYRMEGQVHGRISKERSRRIARAVSDAALDTRKGMAGRGYRVMVTEKGKPGSVMARTQDYRLVVIGEDLDPGTVLDVTVDSAGPAYLIGKIVK